LRQVIALGVRDAWEWSDEKSSYVEIHDQQIQPHGEVPLPTARRRRYRLPPKPA